MADPGALASARRPAYPALVTQLPTGPAWRARTVAIADPGRLEDYLTDEASIAWLRRGDGMVGLGIAERVDVACIADADEWWAHLVARIEHETEMPGAWGTGPVAFGSFVFDQNASTTLSTVIVPAMIIGRRGERCWLTTLVPATDRQPHPGLPERAASPQCPQGITVADDTLTEQEWTQRVSDVVARIAAAGADLEKVVLARSVRVRAEAPIDPRWLVRALTERYPTTWTFQVDALVGASPELLIRSEGGLATSRVLAGTIRRGSAHDDSLEAALSRSEKDLAEHEFAVSSVARALAPSCSGMNVPESPYVLRLPNVMHLASDVTGVADPSVSVLTLAGRLHPSAAVCGTPTEAAKAVIAETESMDRGRYTGPVGWIDSSGDGEWAIALRCGRLAADDPREITLYAGCGIVEQSDPADELAETKAKLQPMLEALGARCSDS